MRENACRASIFTISLLLFSATESLYAHDTGQTMRKDVSVTVFIHGIMSIRHFLGPSNFVKLMYDDIKDSAYHQSLDLVRENPLFYVNQAMQQYGLHSVDPKDIRPGNASGALAHLLEIAQEEKIQNHDTRYYTFGWPGIISHELRKKAGQELYDQLASTIERLRATYDSVHIRIYGFSHGGNVALNMAQYNTENPLFNIDELILLGTPIQEETDFLINDSIFEKVFSIFSPGDRIQTLDCFSFKRFFSSKKFKRRENFELPQKLTQIQIRITEPVHGFRNIEKIDPNNPLIASGKAAFLRDRSPGHAELWFFGWTPQYYRENFPLNPLPTVVLLPKILSENSLETLAPDQYWIADIRPSCNHYLIRQEKQNATHQIVPLQEDLLHTLKQEAERFRPQALTQKEYDDLTYKAIKQVELKNGKKRIRKVTRESS